MAEYIDREALGIGYAKPEIFQDKLYAEGWNSAIKILKDAPTADVVPKAVFEQMRWERDTAVAQLRKDYGVELGERKKQCVKYYSVGRQDGMEKK